jgi:hypothetical protein
MQNIFKQSVEVTEAESRMAVARGRAGKGSEE